MNASLGLELRDFMDGKLLAVLIVPGLMHFDNFASLAE
jgi:hypothetical protein